VISLLLLFFIPTHFDSYLSHGFIPFMNVYPLYGLIYYFPATLLPLRQFYQPFTPCRGLLVSIFHIPYSRCIPPRPVQPVCYFPFYPQPTKRYTECKLHFSVVTENLFLISSLRGKNPPAGIVEVL
jgi:hypothetical protein